MTRLADRASAQYDGNRQCLQDGAQKPRALRDFFARRWVLEWNGSSRPKGWEISHAQLAVAEGALMLGLGGGPFRPPRPGEVTQYVHVQVEDVDEHFERAKGFGARIVTPPTDMPFGERQYTAEDHAGHRWTFSQHVADVAPEQWGAISAPLE